MGECTVSCVYRAIRKTAKFTFWIQFESSFKRETRRGNLLERFTKKNFAIAPLWWIHPADETETKLNVFATQKNCEDNNKERTFNRRQDRDWMKLFVSLFIRQRFNVVTQFITPNCSRDETQPFDFLSDEFGEFFPIVKHTHMIYRSGGKKSRRRWRRKSKGNQRSIWLNEQTFID